MKYLLAILLVGCAVPPYEAAVISLPEAMYPMGDNAARTVCAMNNVPIIIIHPRVVGTLAEPLTLTHEKVHVRQLSTYQGGCLKAMEAYQNDPELKIRWEMEAYCATLTKAEEMGLVIEPVLENIRRIVREQFNRNLSCSLQGEVQKLLGIDRGGQYDSLHNRSL